jgi:lambda family phage portal protein
MAEREEDGGGDYPNYVYAPIQQQKAFEGASTNFKNGLKGLLQGEPDQLAAREIQYLQLRSANAIRNNGYAAIAHKKWVTNAGAIKVLWKDAEGKSHKAMQELWNEFTANPNLDGFGDYSVTQGVSNSSIFLNGNSYIRKIIKRTGNTNIVPLKLQLIPAQLHAIGQSKPVDVNLPNMVVRYGMKFLDSVPAEYYFKKSITEQTIDNLKEGIITSVPAKELVHTFIRNEPGQWLGTPLLAPVLLSLYELDELIDATVSKQKAAQTIAMIVENANNAANMLPVGVPVMRQDGTKGEEKLVLQNRSAGVQYVNKGESVKWFQGGDIGANFQPLVIMELRKIASVCDLMLHELNGDTESLNFSSLIGLSILSRNRLEYLHNFLFIPLREKPIAEAFKELAVLYDSSVVDAKPYFQLPRWRGVDDLKDMQADVLGIQNGLQTYEGALAERGHTPEDIIADRETVKELEHYGIFINTGAVNPSMSQAKNTSASSQTTSV